MPELVAVTLARDTYLPGQCDPHRAGDTIRLPKELAAELVAHHDASYPQQPALAPEPEAAA